MHGRGQPHAAARSERRTCRAQAWVWLCKKWPLALVRGKRFGVLQLVDGNTGEERIMGRYARQSQGRDALEQHSKALFLAHDPRGPSLQDSEPEIFAKLVEQAKLMRHRLREEMQIEFTIQNGELFILDGVRVNRRANAAMRIAVKLAEDGIIPQQEALMRIDPRAVGELLHDRSTQRRNAMFGHRCCRQSGCRQW